MYIDNYNIYRLYFQGLNKNYISKVVFTEAELLEKLSVLLENQSAITFENSEKTTGGYIKNISVSGKTLTGSLIREALDLKSTCFEIEKTDGVYNFTVYGYGHGVGMSQAGADYMAKQGASYEEILKHYYTNCQIEKV
jgi:stage II sporulation protein D